MLGYVKCASKVPRKQHFTGKAQRTKKGIVAIDRKFTDSKAWLGRRKKEKPPPGGWPKPPAHWPAGIRVDIKRPVFWLPEGWGQGVKTTCAAHLRCYISPESKVYYHKHVIEKLLGTKFGKVPADGKVEDQASVEWAQVHAAMALKEGSDWNRKIPVFTSDERLFATLTQAERDHLPTAQQLYFAVVSARRASCESGLRDLVTVQAQLAAGNATPTWYVDKESAASYQRLGLNVKVGGKLVPSRNLALADAARSKQFCVQVSDDIRTWVYYKGALGSQPDLNAGNEAARKAVCFRISPVAAARYLVARMRSAQAEAGSAKTRAGGKAVGPRLAGVFPLGNTGFAFRKEEVTTDNFILGDFFVADDSPCRFNPEMTLKEDYDFTCEHLWQHGQVLRCNRMLIAACHETNAGGAVSSRDEAGKRERENIEILKRRWPGVFWINGKRGDTQVIMSWKRRKLESRPC